jgi:PTH1 family peptidyl-tRNA hydrolase
MNLVVGLGNPGNDYKNTRHNIGWIVVDHYHNLKNNIWKSKFKGEFTELEIEAQKVYFLKPLTYMNLSGESVQPMMTFYKITNEKLLVIQDELDLPFGQIHFKMGGGIAGHNGLRSIVQHIGTENFARLRVGIGRPIGTRSVSDYVLSDFSKEEKINFEGYLDKISEALDYYFKYGMTKAGNFYNKKNLI